MTAQPIWRNRAVVAREVHNLEVVGSSPTPATIIKKIKIFQKAIDKK